MVKKSHNKSNLENKNRILMLSIIFVFTVIMIVYFSLFHNKSLYSIDKNQAQSRLESLMSNLNPDADVVYSNISDAGCGKNGVGLASYTSCKLIGNKYFKIANHDAEGAIQQLNSQLENQGYRASPYNNDYSNIDRLQIAKGLQEGDVLYTDSNPDNMKYEHIVLYVEFTDKNRTIDNPQLRKLVDEGKIAQPSNKEYLFGILIWKTYWNCDVRSILDFCPAPPSK